MDAAVEVVGAAARVHIKATPHPVDTPLQVPVFDLRHEMRPLAALEIQIGGHQTSEVRGMGNASAGAVDGRQQRDRSDDHDKVLRRYRKDEIHVYRAMRKVHRVREQHTEDRSRCAYRLDVIDLLKGCERHER